MFIPNDKLEQIREQACIEDIISKYVPSLKKKGKDFLGLCPFHKEKTPSFSVVPDKKMFYCFGCHTGGNVFTFISKVEKLDFIESVKFVAKLIGFHLEDDRARDDNSKRSLAFKLNNYALSFFKNNLVSPRGRLGLNYLLKRGVSKEAIKDFQIGYAFDSWDYLTARLQKNKSQLNLAQQLGLITLVKKEGRTRYYDRFRNRVIFPILDINNKTIAFGGRIIGEGEPKYLNSPESEFFKKREILYGLNLAKSSIREMDRAIVVEGYLDVIGCHQAGLKNVVAPLGTALTTNQLKLLSRFCKEIILLFDADSAGIRAALKSIDLIEDLNLKVKVAMLPEQDPFDYILSSGPRSFMAVVDSALEPIEFQILEIVKNRSNEDRLSSLIKIFKVIARINFATERNYYLQRASSLLGIDENSLRTDFLTYSKKNLLKRSEGVDNKKKDRLEKSYEELLKLLCLSPELIELAVVDFSLDEIPNPFLKNLFSKLVELYQGENLVKIDKMFDFFAKGEENIFLTKIFNSKEIIPDPKSAYYEIFSNIRLISVEEKIDKYADLVKKSDKNYQQYLTEIEILRREKEKFLSYRIKN